MDKDTRPYADIGERLAWRRSLEGMNQTEFAELAGLKRSQYGNWESGTSRLGLDGALALQKTYGLSLDFLYLGVSDALPMTLMNEWNRRPGVKS